MNQKLISLIPIIIVEIIIQLAFFWLAPEAECYWIVYALMTVLTLTHGGLIFYVEYSLRTRRSMPTVIVGGICQTILLIVCGILLTIDSSVRNALFALIIMALIYGLVVLSLLVLVNREEYNGNLDDENIDFNRHKQSPPPLPK